MACQRDRLRHVGHGRLDGSDDAESMRGLQRAVELNCNFFDTAWAYGGYSEKLLGQLVRAHPDHKLYTASKGLPMNFRWPGRAEYKPAEVFPYQHVIEYTERSLKVLQPCARISRIGNENGQLV